jgi:hypothetical protein
VCGFSEIPYAVALVSTTIWVCYAAATPGRVAAGVTNVLGLTLEVRGVSTPDRRARSHSPRSFQNV